MVKTNVLLSAARSLHDKQSKSNKRMVRPNDMEDNFQNVKVMVIDDSKTIRRTAETLITKVGCEVITATDGIDALSKIADSNLDIVFVVIMMRGLDVWQMVALIKHTSKFKLTHVIKLCSKPGLFDKGERTMVGYVQ